MSWLMQCSSCGSLSITCPDRSHIKCGRIARTSEGDTARVSLDAPGHAIDKRERDRTGCLAGFLTTLFFVVGGLITLWPDIRDIRDEGRLTVLVSTSNQITEEWVRTDRLPDLTAPVSWRKDFFDRKTDVAHVFAICDESRKWFAARNPAAYALVYYPTGYPVEQPIDLVVRNDGSYLESADGTVQEKVDLRGMIVVRLRGGDSWRIPERYSDRGIAELFLRAAPAVELP